MKRRGGLWPRLICFENLYRAAKKAARGKRSSAPVARFLHNLEYELCRLQDELGQKAYRPKAYRTFLIYEPKQRLISAAPFRDRVVHHALCRVLEPIFEPAFIHDSYACRCGKGTHAALDRFTRFARRSRYVLKCDIRKFFPSMDHQILKKLVARKIKDKDVLWLTSLIIDHSNLQEPVYQLFPGDDLLTPLQRRRGLPIGNQTSQFLANVYLNPLDHFVKECLGARFYLRYVDDFVILCDDKVWLAEAKLRIQDFLNSLRLRLHPRKCVISPVEDGTRFLGFRVFPSHRLLARENVVRMKRRLRRLQQAYAAGEIEAEQLRCRIVSWIGHARHADSHRLRERLFRETTFSRRA